MDGKIGFNDLFDPNLMSEIGGLITKIGEVKEELTKMISEVKSKAGGLADALSASSSSTKSGRDNTKEQAAEVDKLYSAYQQLGLSYQYVSQNLEKLLATQEKQNKAAKLAMTVNNAQSDSISRLKAMLDLAKLAYEGMTASQRTTTESGQQLNTVIKTLDSQIKNYNNSLKAETSVSKTQKKETQSLYVSYQSLNGLINETGVNIDDLVVSQKDMEQATKNGIAANSAAEGSYNQLAAQYNLIKIALNNMGSEMRENTEIGKRWEEEAFNIMEKMKAMQESTGKNTLSVGDYEKAMNGLNIASKQVLREMPTLANSASQFFIAISNNIPIFVDNLRRAAKEAGSVKKALLSLVSVQFVLEGVLLVGLTLLSKYGSELFSHIRIFKNVNKEMKAYLELHKKIFDEYNNKAAIMRQEQKMEEDVIQRRIDLLKAQNAPLNQIQKAEQELLDLRAKNVAALKDVYKNNLEGSDVVKDYSRNVAALVAAQDKLRALTTIATANTKKANGEWRKSDKEMVEKQQALVEYYKQRVDAAEELMTAERDLALTTSETAARQYAERYAQYKKEQSLARDTEDLLLSMTEDRYEKERKIAIKETERQIQDIQDILKRAPEWLSAKQRAEYEKQIATLGDVLKMNLIASFHEQEEAIIELQNTNTNIELGLLKEGKEKELAAIKENTDQRKAELMRRYLYEKELSEEERKEIIRQWVLLGREGTQAEKAVILQYAQRDLQTALDYKLAVLENSFNNEYLLNRESINAQIQYWRDYLANIKKYGNLSATELANVTTQVNTEILKLQTSKKKNRLDSLWDFLNIDKQAMSNIKSAFETAMEYMDEWMDKRIEMAEIAVEAAEKETDAAKTALDYEMEARANGYANNVELARREYEEKLAAEKKAIAEKERLQKIQEGIDSAQQAASLITATANIISAYSSIPIWGQILAIAAIATMWATFAAAKVQAAQMTRTTYGEGMAEYLNYGGSHASGNDIDFGRTKDGKQRRVERGEIVGVINKRNVDKYGANFVLGLINSLNNGTFEKSKENTANLAFLNWKIGDVLRGADNASTGLKMPFAEDSAGLAANYSAAFDGLRAVADLSVLESGVGALVEQGRTRVVQTPEGRIEYRGNNKRIIRNG